MPGVTLNDIAMSLADMKSALDVHIKLTQDNDEKLAKVYKDIYIGNGESPLRERVNKLEATKTDPQEWMEIKQWVTMEKKFAWLVAAGVVTQTLILLFQLGKSILSSGAL